MENIRTSEAVHQTAGGILFLVGAAVFAVVFTLLMAQPAHAERVTPPPMPADLEAPAGNRAYLVGHAAGTQQYICLPTGWTQFGPQATLFEDDDKQIITHFLSPNPDEFGTPRPTWQHSKDTSAVWGGAAVSSSDPAFVAPGAIPWLRLPVAGVQEASRGGGKLAKTTYIQRLNTSGGVKPSTGCTEPTEVGNKMLVPYTADYYFYTDANARD